MKYFAFTLLLFAHSFAYSQHWVAGDTTTFQLNVIEERYLPNAKVVFDIDCDGIEDFHIRSSAPIDDVTPWMRLSFYMEEEVEVFNSNTGLVTAFESGDTIPLGIDSLWTPHLDFIFGTGVSGGYGQYEINRKYILFRKKGESETLYCFILFSNEGIDFSIHQVLSKCGDNPIQGVTAVDDISQKLAPHFYPNPTYGTLRFTDPLDEIQIYSPEGRLVFQQKQVSDNIDLSHLIPGVYSVLIKSKGNYRIEQLVKH
jgi:hypothetical protein